MFNSFVDEIQANRIVSDGTPHPIVGLFCLPLSDKKDVRLIRFMLGCCFEATYSTNNDKRIQ